MPANHQINNKSKIIVTTWIGEARDIDFIEAIKKYQHDIQNQPEYIDYNELVNFSKMTKIKLTAGGIKSIGKIASTTDNSDGHKKLALIVTSKLAFGLARMYEVYRNISSNAKKELRIFNNEKEALKWLDDNIDPNIDPTETP